MALDQDVEHGPRLGRRPEVMMASRWCTPVP
jgi:hypothetical protein